MATGTFTFGTETTGNRFTSTAPSGGTGYVYSNIAAPATGNLVQCANGNYYARIVSFSVNMKGSTATIQAGATINGVASTPSLVSLTTAATTTGTLTLTTPVAVQSGTYKNLVINHTGVASIARTATGQTGATGVYLDTNNDATGGTIVAGTGNTTMRLVGSYTYTTAPNAPGGFTATPSTTTSGAINVSWSVPTDTGTTGGAATDITAYQIYIRTGSPGSYSYQLAAISDPEGVVSIVGTGAIPTSGVITGLTPGQTYTFVVRASNALTDLYNTESVDSAPATATAPGVAATPTSFTATVSSTTSGQVNLSWVGGETNGKLLSYEIKKVDSTVDPFFAPIGSMGGSATVFATYTVGENFITARSSSTTTRTVTTSVPHGFSAGNTVTIYGLSDSRYNAASVTVLATNLTTTRFSYTFTGATSFTEGTLASPVANSSGQVRVPTVSRASSALQKTIVLGAAHGLSAGDYITVSNIGTAGYNGTYVLKSGTTGSTIVYDTTTSLTETTTGAPAGYVVANKLAVTGLTPRTQYTFSVRAKNEFTSTSGLTSTPADSAPIYPPTAPEAPTNLKLDDLSAGKVYLSWTAPTDLNGAGTLTGFALFRDGKTLSTTISPSTLTYTDSTVSSGTTYVYTVKSRGSVADGFSPAVANSLGTATVTIASPGVVTRASHGLATGQVVYLTTTGALPTGLTASTAYWVIYVNADTFKLATSLANAQSNTPINTSGTQSGVHTLYTASYSAASTGLSVLATGVPPTVGTVTAVASATSAGKVDISWPVEPSALTYTVYDSSNNILGTVSGTTFSVSGLSAVETTFKVKANNIWGTSTNYSTSNSVTPASTSLQIMAGSDIINVSNRDWYNVVDKVIASTPTTTSFTYSVTDSGGTYPAQTTKTVGSNLGTISDVEGKNISGTFIISTTSPTSTSFTYKRVGPDIASSDGTNISVVNNTNLELSGSKVAYGTLADQAITFPTTLSDFSTVSAAGLVTNPINPAFTSALTTILSVTDTEITYATTYPDNFDPVTAYGTIVNLTNRDIFNSKVAIAAISNTFTRTLTILGSHHYEIGDTIYVSGLGVEYDGPRVISAVDSTGGVYTLSYISLTSFTEPLRVGLSGIVTNLSVDSIPTYKTLTYKTVGAGSTPYSADIGTPYGGVRRTNSAATLRVRYRSGWYG